MTNDRSEDSRLVAEMADADERALRSIYTKYGGAVHSLARKVLNNDDLAGDVVQEVFVSLWRAPERFDAARGSLRSYLLMMAHRRAVDLIRSEEARRRREEGSEDVQVDDPEDQMWVTARSEIVRRAVAALADDERAAISLAYFGGLSYVEVAKRLDQPEGTIKSRIRSGMKKLSSTLSELAQ